MTLRAYGLEKSFWGYGMRSWRAGWDLNLSHSGDITRKTPSFFCLDAHCTVFPYFRESVHRVGCFSSSKEVSSIVLAHVSGFLIAWELFNQSLRYWESLRRVRYMIEKTYRIYLHKNVKC
jgi:hypothetical protein